MSYRMVYDSGSKALKCAIADSEGQIVAIETTYPEVIQSEDGFGRNLNQHTFWDELINLTKQTITKAQIDPSEIRFISSCSIRPSTVFVDEELNPLYISTSFDTRGIDAVEEVESKFESIAGKSLYKANGHGPSLLFSPARYAAFSETLKNSDSPKKIAQYLPMDSFILMKLGAEPHVNYASGAESGFFDLHTKFWADAWTDIFNLSPDFFPLPVQSGEIVGSVSEENQQILGLSSECNIVAGLPDTQSALLGTNCVTSGSITAVLGSTTPVQGISDTLFIDPQEKMWSGLISCKNICDSYIVEANTGICGQIVKWAANLFFASESSELSERYDKLNAILQRFDENECNCSLTDIQNQSIYAFLGPAALASGNTSMPPGQFVFPTPGGVEEIQSSLEAFAGSVMDNILFGVSRNVDILKETLKVPKASFTLTGGITRNLTLNQRFADLFQTNVNVSTDPEATIRGLLLLCDIAEGTIRSKDDLKEKFNSLQILQEYSPRSNMVEKMQTKYQNWQKLFKKYSS